jgi:hypothetical protein
MSNVDEHIVTKEIEKVRVKHACRYTKSIEGLMVCQCFSSQDKRVDDQFVSDADTEEPLTSVTDPEMPHT